MPLNETQLHAQVVQMFRDKGLKFRTEQDQKLVYTCIYSGDPEDPDDPFDTNGTRIRFSPAGQVCLVYSFGLFRVEANVRKAVAEYLVRCNFKENYGNWEVSVVPSAAPVSMWRAIDCVTCLRSIVQMDMNDGEVRFKTSFRFGDAMTIVDALSAAFSKNRELFNKYCQGIPAVCRGESPEQVVASVSSRALTESAFLQLLAQHLQAQRN